MQTFTVEPLVRLRTNRRGKKLAAVRIVMREDGTIVDIREMPIDHTFHTEIDHLLRDGWVPAV